jgi:hypothetical protein
MRHAKDRTVRPRVLFALANVVDIHVQRWLLTRETSPEGDYSMNLPQSCSSEDLLADYLQLSVRSPLEILEELCVLLEDHAPTWYSEKQRNRALAARRLPIEVLVELFALLEDYSPTWYTEEQHKRAISVLRALGLLDAEIDEQH